ncbi:hypothetical protein FACS1894176_11050 [Bacteroidia bacterium]|nr:hypothetical protein FACS189428_4930 [Clostridia bacterium]GHV28483.1 hypothetical protein FACS1894176_11050 [Bacteroidia bacterium]
MQQIIHLHGGDAFPDMETFYTYLKQKNYDPLKEKKYWREWLKQQLPEYQVFLPQMPNGRMASYTARKIWFEKLFPYLNDEGTILIGHSLGATFLLKYLSENIFPQPISKLCLVASSIDEETGYDKKHFLGDFVWDF